MAQNEKKGVGRITQRIDAWSIQCSYLSRCVADKFHLGTFIPEIAYSLFRPLWITRGVLPSEADAEEILSRHFPDGGSSAIRKNQICEPHYDLQVIVPVYNVAKYVNGCIDSILKQKTKYSIIIVLVNDGSTDNSAELIANYAEDPRVKIITQENRGLSGARNRGLEKIYSHYVMFVDSDDTLNDGAIDSLLDTAYRTDSDVVQGAYRVIDINDKITNSCCTVTNDNAKPRDCFGFAWGKVFKAALWKDFIFPEHYWFEDTVMAMLLFLKASSFATVSTFCYNYRMNPQGITRSVGSRPKAIDTFYVTRRMLNDAESLDLFNGSDVFQHWHFFRQVRGNFKRTVCQPDDICRSIFVLTSALYRKYFAEHSCPCAFEGLRNALLKRDYRAYERWCIVKKI